MASFFPFFRQTTDLIVHVPLFSTNFIRLRGNPVVKGSNPCFSHKLFRALAKADETEGSPLSISFGTVRVFSKISLSPKGPPRGPICFDILQQTGVSKSPKSASLFKILKTLRFLSLRYSADFRHSRLVHLRQTKKLTLYVPLFVHYTFLT